MSSSVKSIPATKSGDSHSAVGNAVIVAVAVGMGLWALVQRRELSWPPSGLIANLTTLTGYLALAGPIVLSRQDRGRTGVGDLVWMTTGVLFWLYNGAAVIRGTFDPGRLADPVGAVGLALSVLAVMIAAWRLHGNGRIWTWTNVTGWILGVFWVGVGLATLLPQGGWSGVR